MKAIAIVVLLAWVNVHWIAEALAQEKIGPKQLPVAVQSRDDFIKRCRPGHPQRECRDGVGQPSRVQRVGGEDTWYYDVPLLDPASGRKTSKVQVLFNEDGKVRGLNFY